MRTTSIDSKRSFLTKAFMAVAILTAGIFVSGGISASAQTTRSAKESRSSGSCSAAIEVSDLGDSGVGTLRQAVLDTCADGVITFATNVVGTIVLTTDDLALFRGVTITGPGADQLSISGNGSYRIFSVYAAGSVTITGITMEQGNGFGTGPSGYGGGIFVGSGSLVLDSVTLKGNVASNAGGGVYLNGGGSNEVRNSTFADNNSGGCGAIINDNGSDLSIVNSTFSGNFTTSGNGGALCTDQASTTIQNSTIAGNSAAGDGGGIILGTEFGGGSISMQNTIVAANTATSFGPDIAIAGKVSLSTNGNNLIGDDQGVDFVFPVGTPNGNTDWVGGILTLSKNEKRAAKDLGMVGVLDPQLAPLGYYGGTTLTRPLTATSPAVNNGSATNAPATDQRGAARVDNVDIGAFELNNTPNGGAHIASVPNGAVDVAYDFMIAPDAGAFSYTVTSGALPDGVTLNEGPGVSPGAVVTIAGMPTTPGTYDFSITATDGVETNITNYRFVVFGPSAANVSISGRILTETGKGLRNAVVTITDSNGSVIRTSSGVAGYYRLEGVRAGETYVLRVASKILQFTPRVVTVTDDIADEDFIGEAQ